MAPDPTLSRYVIVSPVKDEEAYIERTLESVIGQTIRPVRWVIVDDGSSDGTPQILRTYAEKHDWIQVLRIERDSSRDLGVTEIRAFAEGYKTLVNEEYDLIAKLDCDLELPADYFERLILEFQKRRRLGIASGVYLEKPGHDWIPVSMPEYHAAGASKVVRRECFESIGGFVLQRGWDTIDEIKALMRGWETTHFTALTFYHLRCEGRAMGARRTNLLHGEIYYVTGGGVMFLALKLLHRCFRSRPYVLGGLGMLWGYLRCVVSGKKRGVNVEEARFYRKLLNGRLLDQTRRFAENAGLPVSWRGGE